MGKTWQGSYTVEAAVVASITVIVLGALILLTFYVHDRAVSQALVCDVTAVGSNAMTEKERSAAVEKEKERMQASRFLGSRNIDANALAMKKKITARFAASYPIPGFAVKYFSNGELSIGASWTYDVIDPAETVRLIRAGKAMAGSVKDLVTGGDD